MEGCGRAHHRLLQRPTNPSCESGKVPGREAPSQINPLATPFYPATNKQRWHELRVRQVWKRQ